MTLLVALDEPPGLTRLGPDHNAVPIPTVGRPLFPTVHRSGRIAYLATTSADPPWQTCIALLTADGELRDLLPDAAAYAPPVWSPCGAYAITVRNTPLSSRLVRTQFDTGQEETLHEQPGLRSAGVGADGALTFSTAAGIYRLGPGNVVEAIFTWQVAADFNQYGNDDLYVTLDQLAISPDGIVAVVVRWHTAGNSARETVSVLRDGRLLTVAPGRYPQWTTRGELILTRPNGDVERYSNPALRCLATLPAGAHSATVCARPTLPSRAE